MTWLHTCIHIYQESIALCNCHCSSKSCWQIVWTLLVLLTVTAVSNTLYIYTSSQYNHNIDHELVLVSLQIEYSVLQMFQHNLELH